MAEPNENALTNDDFNELKSAIVGLADLLVINTDELQRNTKALDFKGFTSAVTKLNNTLLTTNTALRTLSVATGKQTSAAGALTAATTKNTTATASQTTAVNRQAGTTTTQTNAATRQAAATNAQTAATNTNTTSNKAVASSNIGLASSMNSLAGGFSKWGSRLENLTSKLNQTQKDFGISMAGAAGLQADAISASIKSFVDSFNSINFGQIFSGVGNILGIMGDTAYSVGKDLLGGKDVGFGKVFSDMAQNIGTELSKPLPGKAANLPLDPRGKEVLEATRLYQEEFGVINKDLGIQIAQEAKNRGLSAQQLVQARRIFATSAMGDMNKVASIQSRFFDVFQAKGMTPKVALEAIMKYSELIARNGSRFADSFARAAADAKKIGVDLNKISQVGDNIIDDFEGFLESQAALGAMGFGFDSSRLAEIAATGDDAALFNELRSQLAGMGKDITKLSRPERLELEKGFGLNISEMMRLAGLTPGGGKTEEEYSQETNSLLAQLLVLMAVSGPVFSMLGSVLGGISNAVGAAGSIVKWLMSNWGMLEGIFGLLVKGLFASGVGLAVLFATKYGWDLVEKGKTQIAEGKTGEGLVTSAAGGALAGTAAMAALVTGAILTGTGVGAMGGIPMILAALGLGAGTGAAVGASIAYQGGKQEIYGPTLEAEKKRKEEEAKAQNESMKREGFKTFIDPFSNTPRYKIDFWGNRIEQPKSILDPTNPNSPYYKPPTPETKKAQGGLVTGPGTGTSDSIKAMLSNGEYIINAEAAKNIGKAKLDELNASKKAGYDKKSLVTESGTIALNNRDKIIAYADDLVDDKKLPLGSVSKDIENAQNLKKQITDVFGIMKKSINDVFGNTPDGMPSKFESMKKAGDSFFGGLKKTFSGKSKPETPKEEQSEEQKQKTGLFSRLSSLTNLLKPPAEGEQKTGFLAQLSSLTNLMKPAAEGEKKSPMDQAMDFFSKWSAAKKKPTETDGEKKEGGAQSTGFFSKLATLSNAMKPGADGQKKSGIDQAISLFSAFSGMKKKDTESEKKDEKKEGAKEGTKDTKKPKEPGMFSQLFDITKSVRQTYKDQGADAAKAEGITKGVDFATKIPGLAGFAKGYKASGMAGVAARGTELMSKVPGGKWLASKMPGLSSMSSIMAGYKTGGVGGALKSLAGASAGKAIGGALGTLIPIPGIGTMLGSMAGDFVTKNLGKAFTGIKNLLGVKSNKELAKKTDTYLSEGGPIGSIARKVLGKKVGGVVGKIAGAPYKAVSALAKTAMGGGPLASLGGKLANKVLGKKLGGKVSSMASMLTPMGQVKALGKLAGKLFKKKPAGEAATPEAPAMDEFDAESMSRMMSMQQPMQAPAASMPEIKVDTSGIEQKLNNFINALQGIQINMDGAQVAKVLVNASDAAMSAGAFRAQTTR